MDLEYPRLMSIFMTNKTPLTHTWRYKHRKTMLQTYSLLEIYKEKLYNDIHSLHKALCLEELVQFIARQRKFLIKQCYAITTETYYIFPVEIREKICRYIQVPIKFDI